MKYVIITQRLYRILADKVLEKIDGGERVNVLIEEDSFDFTLDAYVYYSEVRNATYYQPEEGGDVVDIVPLWFEFHTYNEEEEEIPNDFEFNKLHKYLV